MIPAPAVISEEEYSELYSQNLHHLTRLNQIIGESHELPEGNYFYRHNSFELDPEGTLKQRNLASLARVSQQILEIGVNAGHSCLVMLMANPKARITAFDLCAHSYVKPCVDYLNSVFGNRITLIEGASENTVSIFKRDHPQVKFDMFHIDGSHGYREANLDFFNCRGLAKNGSYIVLDDTMFKHLRGLWDGYIRDGHLREIFLLDVGLRHSIGIMLL